MSVIHYSKIQRSTGLFEAKLSTGQRAERPLLSSSTFCTPFIYLHRARRPRACQSAMTAERIIRLPSRPPWEHYNSFLICDHESKMDVTGGPNRASTLSISSLPFVLFSDHTKARQSTTPPLSLDVSVDFPFSPVTPPPPLPMLRQAVQQTLARPLHTPPSATTIPISEPRVPAPPLSESVVLSRPGLPKPPQPAPMAVPAMSIRSASVGWLPPQVEPVPPPSYPRVRPLPQRPPTAKPIEDENLWAESDDRLGRSNSAQANGYHSEFDSNALRRNRHIRRAQKVPLNGPRPLPPLPGTSPSISTVLMESYDQSSKRVSSPTQPTTPRVLTALQRSKSDPTSPPLPRRPNLHLVIPKSQAAKSDRRLAQQEPNPTTPCEDDSSGSRSMKPQWHSLDYFPAIDYASVATPSSSRRPPPSAHPDGGKDNTTVLDWHLLEQALGIDGDVGATLSASPVVMSFLPALGAPPVPAIPDRFLVDRELFCVVPQTLLSNLAYSTTLGKLQVPTGRRQHTCYGRQLRMRAAEPVSDSPIDKVIPKLRCSLLLVRPSPLS